MPAHFSDPFGGRSVPRVSVLAGGDSPERDISLASGHAVATAMRELGGEVREIDPVEIPVSRCDWATTLVSGAMWRRRLRRLRPIRRRTDRRR